LQLRKTERYFASAKSVLVCSQKSAFGGTSFLSLRNIFPLLQMTNKLKETKF